MNFLILLLLAAWTFPAMGTVWEEPQDAPPPDSSAAPRRSGSMRVIVLANRAHIDKVIPKTLPVRFRLLLAFPIRKAKACIPRK